MTQWAKALTVQTWWPESNLPTQWKKRMGWWVLSSDLHIRAICSQFTHIHHTRTHSTKHKKVLKSWRITIIAQKDREETDKGAGWSSQSQVVEKSGIKEGKGGMHVKREGQLSIAVSKTQRSQARWKATNKATNHLDGSISVDTQEPAEELHRKEGRVQASWEGAQEGRVWLCISTLQGSVVEKRKD